MKILEFTAPNEDGICYVEGDSEKLAWMDRVVGMEPSEWFCWEETFVDSCRYLSELGFTATQILEAKEAA